MQLLFQSNWKTGEWCVLGLFLHTIHYFHIDHKAPCLPPPPHSLPEKILHNHCFRFLLGVTVVLAEIQDNGFAKFGGGGGGGGGKQGAVWSMRKWWIEFFLELWKCFSLFAAHTLGACLPLCEVPQQISWNFLKMHLLCMNWRLDFMQTNWLFFDVSGKVLSLIRFANDPYTRLNRINASRFAPFRKTRKHVNRGQTQCWALFVISKATFTKTAIKPNLDDRFSLKNFDAAID